jgi:hypothetical protein
MQRRFTPVILATVLTVALSSAVLVPATSAAQVTSTPVAVSAVEKPKPQPHKDGFKVRITTFNILTSSIAAGGVTRARRAARWVQKQGAIASAFQEVAKDQLLELQRIMPGFNFWPKRTLGTRGSAIQIAWKKSDLKLVKTGYVMRPFLGHQRPIPWVRLHHRGTGRDFLLMAIHNAPGGQERDRDISTRKEIAQIKNMVRTLYPVFVIGDVNERSEFCDKVARETPLISMNQGTPRHPCPVPRYGGPDWMLGNVARFSDFKKDYNGISDHPALTALATVPPKKGGHPAK